MCVDEYKLLRDIERLLKRKILKVVLENYEPDPSTWVEPHRNGRNGKIHSQFRIKAEGRRNRQRTSSKRKQSVVAISTNSDRPVSAGKHARSKSKYKHVWNQPSKS